MRKSWESHENFMRVIQKSRESHEQSHGKFMGNSWVKHDIAMRKPRESHEKAMRKLWGSCEKVMRKKCKRNEKSSESHEKVREKSWKSHEQVMRKSWESHEKVMKKSLKKPCHLCGEEGLQGVQCGLCEGGGGRGGAEAGGRPPALLPLAVGGAVEPAGSWSCTLLRYFPSLSSSSVQYEQQAAKCKQRVSGQ